MPAQTALDVISTYKPDVRWRRPRFEAFHFCYNVRLLLFLRISHQIHAEARLLPFSLDVFEGEVDYIMQQILKDLRIEQAGAVTRVRLEISRDDLVVEGPKIRVTQLKSNLRFLIGVIGLRCSSLVEPSWMSTKT
ncbi:hypothetical protein HBI25_153590 [Parastagonospora nodorum]|nr:hypothetical protein HBI10_148900 [Parastagonospora nodorum]KAH4020091.1 hypothetical protein HBI13_122040 [Parastagonospora nodorum]KAH4197571.1 hypothetical protein HBH42_059030 [Parastagonospora nodorum]KAH4215167.1 hypothetical protein HBI95_018130 [Parastagonospora nodorum]KAH4259372.1 hypothetical protein HBI03_134050 [Parastagonospora nodorum]